MQNQMSKITVTCRCGADYTVPSFSRGELFRCVKCGHSTKIATDAAPTPASAPSERTGQTSVKKRKPEQKTGVFAGVGALAILGVLLALRAKA